MSEFFRAAFSPAGKRELYFFSRIHSIRGRRPPMCRFRTFTAVFLVVAMSGCSSQRFARNRDVCCPTYVCRPVCGLPCQPTFCNSCPRPCSWCGGGAMDSIGGVPMDQMGGAPIDSMGGAPIDSMGGGPIETIGE